MENVGVYQTLTPSTTPPFPAVQTYVPVMNVDIGTVSVAPTAVKANFTDWGYKLDMEIYLIDFQFSNATQFMMLSIPGGYTTDLVGCVLEKKIYQDTVGWHGDIIMQVNSVSFGAGKDLLFNVASGGHFVANVPSKIICTGSLWLS